MNIKRPIFLTVLVSALICGTGIFLCFAAESCSEITDISGEKYFPAVKEALSKAKESINMVMFAVESVPKKEDSKVNQLINELIEAKNRGVEVEIILDQNVDFVRRGYSSDWEKDIKNIEVSVLIDSEELAQKLLNYFKTIKIDEDIKEYKERS